MTVGGIHDAILSYLKTQLTLDLITNVTGVTKAGIVKIGDLQGEPAPDDARISVTLYMNDPDSFISGSLTSVKDSWEDEVYDFEIGGAITWKRRFTLKVRFLYANSREELDEARRITTLVRDCATERLLSYNFNGVVVGTEYAANTIANKSIHSESLQSGGPPDAYDYFVKIRFEVLTTKTGV